jgi:hypothetical protein
MTKVVDEANVIGSAVRLDEIPPKFRQLPFLGRGATTLAFAKDENTVYIFTRDSIKMDWLSHGLHMVSHSEIVNPVRTHHMRGMRDVPLYLVEMPRLYPLSPQNRSIIAKEVKEFASTVRIFNLNYSTGKYARDYPTRLQDAARHYEKKHPNSKIVPFLEWLLNYDPSQYSLDIGARQFKQTAHGEIVLLDPVVDRELLNIIRNHLEQKFYYNPPRR